MKRCTRSLPIWKGMAVMKSVIAIYKDDDDDEAATIVPVDAPTKVIITAALKM